MLTTHPIRSTAAITLALAGICAPTASAVLIPGDPHPLAHAQRAITNAPIRTPASSALCGDVCSGHGYSPVSVTTRTPPSSALCGDVCSGHGYSPVSVTTRTPPSSALCGDVCSGHGYGSVAVTTRTPPSSALCGDVCSGHGYGSVAVTTHTPASSALCGDVCSGHGYGSVGLTTMVVRPGAANQGFDWADAAIGAAAAIGLILGATGAALLLARRRTESHTPTDVPTAS